ncbi:CBO0543 family protein [Bacillus sp. 1P10SD]|uniref:CBO0543 family protein n=1 Tax=Bacillus sp. 1P10SD TaxID=3132265 RepID=UPI0039A57ABE
MEELIKLSRKIAEKRNEYWLHDVFFTYQWWLLLGLTILPWILWWKLVDKKRIIEILLYGTVISLYSILLDDIGSHFTLWIYQYQLIPISARLNPIDLTVMPITFMIVYQYFKKWKTFLIAQTILAAGATFVAEPIFTWMEIYEPLNWEYYYSFLIYILLGVVNKWFVERLLYVGDSPPER